MHAKANYFITLIFVLVVIASFFFKGLVMDSLLVLVWFFVFILFIKFIWGGFKQWKKK